MTDPFGPDVGIDDFLVDYMGRVEELIADVGWMLQGAFPTSLDPHGHSWVYTIGLGPSFGHPELVIFGLPFESAAPLLNGLGDRVAAGESFPPGRRTDVVRPHGDAELPVQLLEVTLRRHRDEWFAVGRRYYREHDLGVPAWLQLVWPDKTGRLPWDDGCDDGIRAAQPLLGAAPS